MKTVQTAIICFILLIAKGVFAERLLAPPTGPTQCEQAYANSAQPKVYDTVLSSMEKTCRYSGGMRVTHEYLQSYVLIACINENPDKKLLSCLFSITGQEIDLNNTPPN